MILEYRDVIPHLKKWARYFHRRFPRFEEDELYNVAYTGRLQKLGDIKLASRCIKFDIMNHITSELRRSTHQDIDKLQYVLVAEVYDVNQVDNQDILDDVMSGVMLDEREKTIILLHYYCGVQLKDIALTLNVHRTRVTQILSGILEKLRRAYEHTSNR